MYIVYDLGCANISTLWGEVLCVDSRRDQRRDQFVFASLLEPV